MHGLINRAIERFLRDTYGQETWQTTLAPLDVGFAEFEAMLTYDDALTHGLLASAAQVLERSVPEILEDLGTYLVFHPNMQSLRRLLRFGGSNFEEFLHSLDDLPDRARLAVSGLILPRIDLREHTRTSYTLTVCAGPKDPVGFGHVMMGLLRAMADDFGALVYLEHCGNGEGCETVSVTLLDPAFAAGRDFNLGAGAEGLL